MALPTFVGIGVEKAGTSALWVLLRQHPDIFLFDRKETLYFSRTRGITPPYHYEWNLFKNYTEQRAIGEISPEYIRSPGAARAIREVLGPVKIIICLREPLARAFSHYRLCLSTAEENRSFHEACDWDARLPPWSGNFMDFRRAYVRGSRYPYQINAWKDEFGAENIFYCILERDFADQTSKLKMLKRLFSFLNVSETAEINLDTPRNSVSAPRVVIASNAGLGRSSDGTEIRYAPGDILFQTGSALLNRILRRPSPALQFFFRKMAAEMTVALSPEDKFALRKKFFAAVAERTSQAIGEDVTHFWASH